MADYDPNDVLIVFEWADLEDTLGGETLTELSNNQLEILKNAFVKGICESWTEIAEMALDIALENTDVA